jgi:hypothetical protein
MICIEWSSVEAPFRYRFYMIEKLFNFFLVGRSTFHFNFVPSVNHPHGGSFVFLFARSIIFPFLFILALYPFFTPSKNGYEFSTSSSVMFGFCFVFFEEQARWLFTSGSLKKFKECLKFTIYFILCENILYLLTNDLSFIDFLISRMGSILLHVTNGYICYLSYRYSKLGAVTLFCGALVVHFTYNGIGPHFTNWLLTVA